VAEAHLTGIFPRSEALIAATRALERGRGDRAALERLFEEETRRLVALQAEYGLDFVTDGQLRWQDLLRPLSDALPGVHAGPVTRWFDNNSFYRRPVIEGPLVPVGGAVLGQTSLGALDGRPWKAILPSPSAFVALSEDRRYGGDAALLADAAEVIRAEATGLVAAGCRYVQFSDPVLVARPREGALAPARRALARVTEGLGVRTGLHTCFGDAGPLLAELLEFPVDDVGIDLFATDADRLAGRAGNKGLLIGALDARNSLLEDAAETAETVRRVADRLHAGSIAVVPNCELEFLPYEVAVAKVRRLGEVKRLVR
jgi:5-methyltetrahydropteroyltriglutamate--homocysteine methyltransferase